MENDIIKNSFKDYQESEPVDEGGFHVEAMNKCIASSSGSLASARLSSRCR